MALQDNLGDLNDSIGNALISQTTLGTNLKVPSKLTNPLAIPTITCRELKVDKKGNFIDLEYVEMEQEEIPFDQLQNTINAIVANRFKLPKPKKPRMHLPGGSPKPPMTSLSISISKPTVLLLLIESPYNVYFSENGTPFTYDGDRDNDRFYDARKVDRDGNIKEHNDKVRKCQIALLTINPPSSPDYWDPFNIHVDLFEAGGNPDFNIPIIIDPDVRYPGGSGP